MSAAKITALSPIERARQAYKAVAVAKGAVLRERDKLATMLLAQQQQQQERDRLQATEIHDAAVRLVDGEAAEGGAS